MITNDTLKTSFQNFKGCNENPMKSIRKKSFNRLIKIGFPTKKLEQWKYTPLKRIKSLNTNIQPTLTDNSKEPFKHTLQIMGHNGSAYKALPKGLNVFPIKDFIQNHGEKYIKQNEFSNYFGLINKSFLNMGCVIHVDRDTKISTSLELVDSYQITHSLAVRHIVILEHGSQLNLLRRIDISGDNTHFASLCDKIILHKKSKINYTYIQHSDGLAPPIISESLFDLSTESSCDYSNIEIGSKFSKRGSVIKLKGENSSFNYRGLSFSKNDQILESHIDLKHKAPKTKSVLLQKNIAIDKSRGIYAGSVSIHKNSSQASSSQMNKNLVIGTQSEVNTVPNLSVDTSDVAKAVHGATTGQLDKEALFYLQSRGFSKKEAIQFLLKSFLMHIVSEIKDPNIQDYVCRCVETEINTKLFHLSEPSNEL